MMNYNNNKKKSNVRLNVEYERLLFCKTDVPW